MYGLKAPCVTKSTLRPSFWDNKSSTSTNLKYPPCESGENLTNMSISLSGRTSPLAVDPNTPKNSTPYFRHIFSNFSPSNPSFILTHILYLLLTL